MLYPNTQPSGVVGGGQDNKKRLQQLLSRSGAAPMFGSTGRSASVESLPSAGASPLSFNPFLKMLAGHPGETLDSLPAGNPMAGFVGSSVPTSSVPPQGGGFSPAPNGGFVPSQQQANPFDAGGNSASTGHFNDTGVGNFPGPPPTNQPQDAGGVSGFGIGPTNPLYHTLLQLAMYGLDS